jgi:tetratricopeptide (TPR) repeat protein
VLARLGHTDACIVLLESLISQGPDSDLPYFFLVEQYLAHKDYEQAISTLNTVELNFGRLGKVSFLRGVAYTYLKNWLKAYMEFQEAEKMSFKSANF